MPVSSDMPVQITSQDIYNLIHHSLLFVMLAQARSGGGEHPYYHLFNYALYLRSLRSASTTSNRLGLLSDYPQVMLSSPVEDIQIPATLHENLSGIDLPSDGARSADDSSGTYRPTYWKAKSSDSAANSLSADPVQQLRHSPRIPKGLQSSTPGATPIAQKRQKRRTSRRFPDFAVVSTFFVKQRVGQTETTSPDKNTPRQGAPEGEHDSDGGTPLMTNPKSWKWVFEAEAIHSIWEVKYDQILASYALTYEEQANLAQELYKYTLPQLVSQAFCAFKHYRTHSRFNIFFAVDVWVKRISFQRDNMPTRLEDISKLTSQRLGELYVEEHTVLPYRFLVEQEPVIGGGSAPSRARRATSFLASDTDSPSSPTVDGGAKKDSSGDVGDLCGVLRSLNLDDGDEETDTAEFLPEDEIDSPKLYLSAEFETDWKAACTETEVSIKAALAGRDAVRASSATPERSSK